MKKLRIPFWVWILIAIVFLFSFRTCGFLDRLLGISGCVKDITSGPSQSGLLISQDGKKLVVTSTNNYVQIRDSLNGSLLKTIELDSQRDIVNVSISSDGSMLAYQDICGSLQILSIDTGNIIFDRPWNYGGCEKIFKIGKGPVGDKVAFLPGNQQIAFVITTRVVDITKSSKDLIVTDISSKKDIIRLTDLIADKSMEEISVSSTGKWVSLRYKDRYELRALADFSLVETATRNNDDAKWYEISPDGQLIKSRVFSSTYSQDGSLKAKSSFCDTDIISTKTGAMVLTLSQPRIGLGDQLERISNFFGDPYCSDESIVFTSDNKYFYYSYRDHILKWRLP